MPVDAFDSLIVRIPAQHPKGTHAIRVVLDSSGAVTREPGTFARMTSRYYEYDVQEAVTLAGPIELDILSVEDPTTGQVAQVRCSLYDLRLRRGKAAQLATLLHHERLPPKVRFVEEVGRMADPKLAQLSKDLVSSFSIAARTFARDLQRDVAARTGIDLRVELRRVGERGRTSIGPTTWKLEVLDHSSVPVQVTIVVDDEPERLAPVSSESDASQELALVQRTVARCLSQSVKLEDLRSAMGRVEGRVEQELRLALAPLARRVVRCALRLEMEIERRNQPLLGQAVVEVRQRSHSLRADTVALPRDAGLMARTPIADFEAWWSERLVHHALAVLPGYDDATLVLDFESAAAVLRDLLTADLEAHGYGATRVRVIQTDKAPRIPATVTVADSLLIDVGIDDQPLGIALRATVAIRDAARWINAGQADLSALTVATVREWMEGKLRTEDRVDALRQFESHGKQVVAVVEDALAEVGARLDSSLRLEPVDNVVLTQRIPLEGTFRLAYDGGAYTADVHYSGLAELMADGRWLYLSAPVDIATWAGDRVRELTSDVFRGEAREVVATRFVAMTAGIRGQLARELPLRGYELADLAIRAPEIAVDAPKSIDLPFAVHTRLGVAKDTVQLEGVIELSLVDPATWIRAGEPEIDEWATRHLKIAFERTIRSSVASLVDTARETLRRRIEEQLKPYMADIGYELRSFSATFAADPAGPREFEEVVAPLSVRMGHRAREIQAVVQLKLDDAARWRDEGIRDVRAWVTDQITAITKTVLFKESYTQLLLEAGGRSGQGKGPGLLEHIEQEMDARARRIGYTVAKVMTLEDSEVARLQEGFNLHVEGEYTTAWHRHAFKIHVTGLARVERLDDIRVLLDRDVRVVERIQSAVDARLKALVATLNPNHLAFRFTEGGAKSPRQVIIDSVSEVLIDLGVQTTDLSITLEAPELFERVRPLRGCVMEMRVRTGARGHHGDVHYIVRARIVDLSPSGQNLDATNIPSLATLEQDLQRHLVAKLADLGAEQLVARGEDDLQELEERVDSIIRKYSSDQMNLDIVLADIYRESSEDIDLVIDIMRRDPAVAMAHYYKVLATLRQTQIQQIEAGDHDGAAITGGRIRDHETNQKPALLGVGVDPRSNGSASGVGTAHRGPYLLPEQIELAVAGPRGGYRCLDPEDRLLLDATVSFRLGVHHQVTRHDLAAAARAAIESVLQVVEPAEFHLGFERPYNNRVVHDELEEAILGALERYVDRSEDVVVTLKGPSPAAREAWDSLRRQVHTVSLDAVRPAQADRALRVTAELEVRELAPSGFGRFCALVPRYASFAVHAGEILQGLVGKISIDEANDDAKALVGLRFAEALRSWTGLVCDVREFKVSQLLTEAERMRLKYVEDRIADLEKERLEVETDQADLGRGERLKRVRESLSMLYEQRGDLQRLGV